MNMTYRFSLTDCQSPQALHELAERLTPVMDAAGAAIMDIKTAQMGGGIMADKKSDGSPVTMADASAEAIILPALAKFAPDVPVISEENASSHHLKPKPIFWLTRDGTKEFIKADDRCVYGKYRINLSGRACYGAGAVSARDQFYSGVVGSGAILRTASGTRSISVRDIPSSGMVAVASASHRDAETDQWLSDHGITDTVSIGSSLKFGLLASAQADIRVLARQWNGIRW